jgi:hypothetical protein
MLRQHFLETGNNHFLSVQRKAKGECTPERGCVFFFLSCELVLDKWERMKEMHPFNFANNYK